MGSGEHRELPQQGPGQSPGAEQIWCILIEPGSCWWRRLQMFCSVSSYALFTFIYRCFYMHKVRKCRAVSQWHQISIDLNGPLCWMNMKSTDAKDAKSDNCLRRFADLVRSTSYCTLYSHPLLARPLLTRQSLLSPCQNPGRISCHAF